jgi:hypothetical protein
MLRMMYMHTAMYVCMTESEDGQVSEARDSPVLFRTPVWRTAGSDLHGVNQQCNQVESSLTQLMLPRLVVVVGGSWSDVTSVLPRGPRLPEGEAGMLLFNLRFLLLPLPQPLQLPCLRY